MNISDMSVSVLHAFFKKTLPEMRLKFYLPWQYGNKVLISSNCITTFEHRYLCQIISSNPSDATTIHGCKTELVWKDSLMCPGEKDCIPLSCPIE